MIAVTLAVIAGLFMWWRARGGDGARSGARRAAQARRLDVEKYRASYRERLERARQVVERRKRAMVDAGTAENRHKFHGMARETLTEPVCLLGRMELCEALDETVDDCDEGDAQACLAIGQYLADTPPRPLIALAFFFYACRAGDEEGCVRAKEIKEGPTRPCDEDILACAWKAYRANDAARLDDACELGVADACITLTTHYKDDPPRERGYLEKSCQAGWALACNELGLRLSPDCKPEPDINRPCYAPDPAEAAEAKTIACEAGFEEACS